jgi:hypothetical protein
MQQQVRKYRMIVTESWSSKDATHEMYLGVSGFPLIKKPRIIPTSVKFIYKYPVRPPISARISVTTPPILWYLRSEKLMSESIIRCTITTYAQMMTIPEMAISLVTVLSFDCLATCSCSSSSRYRPLSLTWLMIFWDYCFR